MLPARDLYKKVLVDCHIYGKEMTVLGKWTSHFIISSLYQHSWNKM